MALFVLGGIIHGSSPYRSTHDRLVAKALGLPTRTVVPFRIKPPGKCSRVQKIDGRKVFWPEMADPFLPGSFNDRYHPSGNSLCYMVQTAHLLGADPIYALGFTLQAGSTYFFGRENPVTVRPPIYDTDRALHWLAWYRSQHPGRLKLLPGFSGPVYDCLETEDIDAYRERLAGQGPQPTGSGAAARVAEPVPSD